MTIPLGILGAGQLGRMTAQFGAYPLGIPVVVFGQKITEPACQVATIPILGEFNDKRILDIFASEVKLTTLEWENVPLATLQYLSEKGCACMPGEGVLRVTQDRLLEKQTANSIQLLTPPFQTLEDALANPQIKGKIRVKMRSGGYDGHGQWPLESIGYLCRLPEIARQQPCIVEGHVDFVCELSVIVARSADGKMICYPAVQNFHEHGILRRTVWPSPHITQPVERRAQCIAKNLARRLGVVGLLAVEMFLDKSGNILINEMAPRPHNSGHWTIDACVTSQFEQLVRAILGLPFGSTEPLYHFEMINLLGEEVNYWRELLQDPLNKVHLYGKTDIKPGRKMGHYTRRVSAR